MVAANLDRSLVGTDPVEKHILLQLERLRQQNTRMRLSVDKSRRWESLKDMSAWKPFDFYNYFCHLYQEKYNKIYRGQGNLVRAYQTIEAFVRKNKITNADYRSFVETAFARHFNFSIIPTVGNICSPSLYAHLMGVKTQKTTVKDLQDLDVRLAKENEEFEHYVQEARRTGEW